MNTYVNEQLWQNSQRFQLFLDGDGKLNNKSKIMFYCSNIKIILLDNFARNKHFFHLQSFNILFEHNH